MADSEILLVEDNPADMKLALHAFREHRLASQVFVARDGEQALDFVFARGSFSMRSASAPVRLILLDLKVPKIDGFQVLKEIRSDPRTSIIPIVVLTSSNQNEDIRRSYELGANSYIQKPVDFDAFSEAIRQIGSYWMGLNWVSPTPGDRAMGEKES